jgi:two-component system sensor kinase FixL
VNLITILWSMAAAVSLSVGVIHGMVWLSDRKVRAELWFALAAVCMSAYPFFDMAMMRATTGAAYGEAARWALLPISLMTAAILMLVHAHMGTGRRWLLIAALGSRLAAIVVNMVCPQGLFFDSIEGVKTVTLLGEAVSLPVGVPGRWMWVEHLGAVIWIGYITDASARLWRRGDKEGRRRVVMIGGGILLVLVAGLVQASLVVEQVISMPVMVTPFFTLLILAMGFELSRDVLRAAQLSHSLAESEKRLGLAATAAQLALWEWDLRTNLIWVSNEGRRIYGVGPDEIIDFPRFVATLHPEDRDMVAAEVDKTMSGTGLFSAEYRVALPDGKERWVAATGRFERDEKGRALLLRGVSMDITERKRSEQELMQKRQDLTHLSRVSMLGELAGTIAHELNQPLAAMLSNSQVGRGMFDAPNPDMKELAAILEDITSDAKRAGSIIHGMRAMFKKESLVERQPVSLNDAVNQVCGLLHSEIVVRKAKVVLSLAESLPEVMAGRVEIQQVLINLVLNSLDAIKAAGNSHGQVHITTEHRDGRVIVSVSDNGPGITPEIQARLFEAFATSKPGGLGLGLAISMGIIKNFEGELTGGNQPGGGAVFCISLPAAEK